MARKPGSCSSPDAGMDEASLTQVVDRLCAETHGLARSTTEDGCWHHLPSRDTIIVLVEDLRSALFPGYFGTSEISGESMRFHVGATLDRVSRVLSEQVRRGMCFFCEQETPNCSVCDDKARDIATAFLSRLPDVQRLLSLDVQAHFEGDPAALCPDETVLCYPGVFALTNFRLAHELYCLDVPLLPRIITEHAHSLTGIDIHPGASIGERFFIDHGTGVVIGETTVIADNVKMYQGVTLGAKSFPLDDEGNPIKGIARHPVVESNVILYGGATILGRVTIGEGAVIGGNVWLTHSVPPGSRITQAQARQQVFQGGAGI